MNNNLQWERLVLPNGIRFLLLPRPAALTTQIAVGIEYGSNDDPSEKSGAAHFVEHLVPGGSENRIELSRKIEILGGKLDISTSQWDTFCEVDVVPERAYRSAEIISSLLFGPSFDEKVVERERKVILNEIAEISDDAYSVLENMLCQSLFKTHPARNPVEGYKKTVSKLIVDDLQETYQYNYVPQKTVLILTGKLAGVDTKAIARLFETAPNPKVVSKKAKYFEKEKPKSRLTKGRNGLSQAYLSIGTRTVEGGHHDTPVLEMLNIILGVGASSRLFVKLREQNQLAYGIESSLVYGLDYGYFHVNCATTPQHVKQSEKIIRTELKNLVAEGISDEELTKARDVYLGSIMRNADNPAELPSLLFGMEYFYGNEEALAKLIDAIKSVTADEVVDVASKYMIKGNYSTVILNPKE